MDNILGIQIMGVLFGLFMIYVTFLYQRRNEFTVKESIFWFGAWIGFMAFVVFPTMLDFLIGDILNFSRRIDFFIVIGFMFLVAISFHTYTIMRKTQNKIEFLVRKLAIDKGPKK